MYKIAAVGDKDSIYGFASLGLDIFPCDDYQEASRIIRRLSESNYAVIYVTEVLCARLEQLLNKLSLQPLPAVIPIPGVSGNNGLGMALVSRSVEQAVGSDIIK